MKNHSLLIVRAIKEACMGAPDRLRKIRRYLGITQIEMSKRLGLSASTWPNYERGAFNPNWEILSNLASLGFSIHWIITGHGQMLTDDGVSVVGVEIDQGMFVSIAEQVMRIYEEEGRGIDFSDLVLLAVRFYNDLQLTYSSRDEQQTGLRVLIFKLRSDLRNIDLPQDGVEDLSFDQSDMPID